MLCVSVFRFLGLHVNPASRSSCLSPMFVYSQFILVVHCTVRFTLLSELVYLLMWVPLVLFCHRFGLTWNCLTLRFFSPFDVLFFMGFLPFDSASILDFSFLYFGCFLGVLFLDLVSPLPLELKIMHTS